MNFSEIKITINDVIKLIGFLFSLFAFYFQLKSDMKELMIRREAENIVIDYRIKNLENETKAIKTKLGWLATLPEKPRIKDDGDNY
jgi:hypothetical protein